MQAVLETVQSSQEVEDICPADFYNPNYFEKYARMLAPTLTKEQVDCMPDEDLMIMANYLGEYIDLMNSQQVRK